jgi:hypothetical protein
MEGPLWRSCTTRMSGNLGSIPAVHAVAVMPWQAIPAGPHPVAPTLRSTRSSPLRPPPLRALRHLRPEPFIEPETDAVQLLGRERRRGGLHRGAGLAQPVPEGRNASGRPPLTATTKSEYGRRTAR